MSRVSPFFYLGHLGREFLVLITCFSCSTGSGYPKITLPGTRVEEGTFLLLTEIHLSVPIPPEVELKLIQLPQKEQVLS